MVEQTSNQPDEPFEGWAILELMGRRRLGGFIAEQQIAGVGFLRIDIPGPDTRIDEDGPETTQDGGFEGGTTQFYSPSAVYCITPATQDIAVEVGRRSHPAPVQRFELTAPSSPGPDDDDDEPDF